jgi:hypothetical protein
MALRNGICFQNMQWNIEDLYQNIARTDSEDKGSQIWQTLMSCLKMRCWSPWHVGFIALDSVVHGGTGIEGLEGGKFQEVDLRSCFSKI